MIDLSNQKFGKLTVLKLDEKKKASNPYWICQCECGKIKSIRGDHLRYGKIKTCGCGQVERAKKLGKKYVKNLAEYNHIEIKGRHFGELVAIQMVGYTEKQHTELWKCKCSCGATQIVNKLNLLSGHTKSCGCKLSVFEKEVAEILKVNGINFTKNKTFDNCRFDNGIRAKFDFYVDDGYIIECDGKQHLWGNKDKDEMKNKWCKDNNITLIRLPHTVMGVATIEDLKPETSTYIMNRGSL